MQIVGDGDGDSNPTWFSWQGNNAGPVIKISGPSKATLRDFSINGNNTAANVLMTNLDQSGSRVFMHQAEFNVNQSNLFVNGLDNTNVLAYNSRFSEAPGISVNVVGGPLASGGNPQQGRTIIYAANEGYDKGVSYEVSKGGNLLIRDEWYEANQANVFLNLYGLGTCVVEGCQIAAPNTSAVPQISLKDFSGKASLINTWLFDTVSISGNGSQTNFLGLGVQFGDRTMTSQPAAISYIKNTSSGVADLRSLNCRANDNAHSFDPYTSGSYAVNDIGNTDSTFIANMFQSSRNVHAQVLTSLPSGISDVRLYRVWNYLSLQAIELQGAGVALALNFLSLNADCKNGNIVLNWRTATENNSHKFNIEKSLDGNTWNVIGTAAAAGFSSSERSYNYIDKDNTGGFYRIAAYDINGKKTLSPVIKSLCNTAGNTFSVAPNPVKNVSIVSISSDQSSLAELSLYDNKASLVKKITAKVLPGNNKIELNMAGMINGVYILRTAWAGNIKITRLEKVN
jgi:hypothetical protein